MKRLMLGLNLLVSAFLLSACSHLHMYQPTVQQGNVVTEEEISHLKPGMSQAQVIAILGEPVLSNNLNPDELNYIYTLQKNGGKIQKKALNLYFNNGRLVKIENNYR